MKLDPLWAFLQGRGLALYVEDVTSPTARLQAEEFDK
jgi:hypothetical protein